MMPDKICFVTSNENKFKEAQHFFSKHNIELVQLKVELDELQDDDTSKITLHKLKQAKSQTELPLFVEDTSLYFEAFNKLPGPYIKFFLQNIGAKNFVKLLEPFKNYNATAECCIAYSSQKDNPKVFIGQVSGKIVKHCGINKFGWDPVFQPRQYDGTNGKPNKTYAQLTTEEKRLISHRGLALKQLIEHLKNQA